MRFIDTHFQIDLPRNTRSKVARMGERVMNSMDHQFVTFEKITSIQNDSGRGIEVEVSREEGFPIGEPEETKFLQECRV